jgi:YgiT-type zinc finger domain-containing protein
MSQPPDPSCSLCGGRREPGTTTWTADLGGTVVVVRDVPASVCAQCGEAWLEHVIVLRLDEMARAAAERGAEVEVLRMAS